MPEEIQALQHCKCVLHILSMPSVSKHSLEQMEFTGMTTFAINSHSTCALPMSPPSHTHVVAVLPLLCQSGAEGAMRLC